MARLAALEGRQDITVGYMVSEDTKRVVSKRITVMQNGFLCHAITWQLLDRFYSTQERHHSSSQRQTPTTQSVPNKTKEAMVPLYGQSFSFLIPQLLRPNMKRQPYNPYYLKTKPQ